MKQSLLCSLLGLCAFLSVPAGHAAVAIPGDITITGTMEMDDFFGSGTVIQSGRFYSSVNSVEDERTYLGPPGDVLPSGSVTANFTHHGGGVVGDGDGFGIEWNLSADSSPGDLDDTSETDIKLGAGGGTPIVVTNNSLIDTYQVFFSIQYDHTVEANGSDAFVESDLEVEINGLQIFEAEIISDTDPAFGNTINKVDTGDAGGEVTDSGTFFTSLTLAPGTFQTIGFDYTGNADAFPPIFDGTGSGTGEIILSVDNIVLIPEPDALALLFAGLVLTAGLRRKRI
ncbi:MAG: PEP-CTERM sorting domain-containing protein [Verrucomicrobiota bacterium]